MKQSLSTGICNEMIQKSLSKQPVNINKKSTVLHLGVYCSLILLRIQSKHNLCNKDMIIKKSAVLNKDANLQNYTDKKSKHCC